MAKLGKEEAILLELEFEAEQAGLEYECKMNEVYRKRGEIRLAEMEKALKGNKSVAETKKGSKKQLLCE